MRTLPALLLLAASTPASASPLNPWGAHVGDKVVAVTPFIYGGPDGAGGAWISPYLYGQYGVTERFELLAGVGATVVPPASFDSIELMPRYFFSDSTGVALHATWSPGAIELAPEWHGIYELGPIGLTVNAGWAPAIGLGAAGGFSPGSVYALVAPEYYFNDATSVFVELDPSVAVDGSTDQIGRAHV